MERLQQWLQPEWLDQQARQTKFMRRKPKKLPPLLFVQAAILLIGQSAVSLSRWAILLGVLSCSRLSKQAIWERINPSAVCLLQQVLGLIMAQRVMQRAHISCAALRLFKRVLIQDSTTLKLTPGLAAYFPGSRNQRGAKNGQLKIQVIHELLSQGFLHFGLSGFTRNDQAAAPDVLPLLQKGDLVLRDLGYFVVQSLEKIAQAGASFLSRLRLDTSLFDPQTNQPINLLGQLKRYGQLDIPVLVGQQKLCARLVALKLPEPVAAQRRRKAKQNRDRRCKPNARHLALLGWAIFITNVDRQALEAKAVAKVYGLRWRIETIFKAWKSYFRVTTVPKGSEAQLLAVIYARLIFITVMTELCKSWQAPWRGHARPARSLLKVAALIGDFVLSLCLAAWQPRLHQALLLQLDYHCCYEHRTRKNFVEILMKLS